MTVTKATPDPTNPSICAHCGDTIRTVPGGNGPVPVHDDGYVACRPVPAPVEVDPAPE
jgi:hypothetical protein